MFHCWCLNCLSVSPFAFVTQSFFAPFLGKAGWIPIQIETCVRGRPTGGVSRQLNVYLLSHETQKQCCSCSCCLWFSVAFGQSQAMNIHQDIDLTLHSNITHIFRVQSRIKRTKHKQTFVKHDTEVWWVSRVLLDCLRLIWHCVTNVVT